MINLRIKKKILFSFALINPENYTSFTGQSNNDAEVLKCFIDAAVHQ